MPHDTSIQKQEGEVEVEKPQTQLSVQSVDNGLQNVSVPGKR